MARIKIKDVTIDMPFEPYKSQIDTMEQIITCLSEGSTGMIESPTGTGKSLSILCSVLAFREHLKRIKIDTNISKKLCASQNGKEVDSYANNGKTDSINTNDLKDGVNSENIKNDITKNKIDNYENNVNLDSVTEKLNSTDSVQDFKIVICSRTHKQLDQLVHQLNKTRYRPRISILASRNQYCINPKLDKVSDKNAACNDMVKKQACSFFVGKDRLAKRMGQRIFDIEEIVREGKRCNGCPYFASRKLNDEADIVFAPYNYLLDIKVRENTNFDLSKCVVIIDEAHNIDDVCRSSGSVELTSKILDIITNELLSAIRQSTFLGPVKNNFIQVLEMFKKFRERSDKIKTFDKSIGRTKIKIKKGKQIKEELEEMGITKEFMTIYKDALYSIGKEEEAKDLVNRNTWNIIESIDQILSALLFTNCDVYSYAFTKEENNYKNSSNYSFNFWLMDSAYIFGPFVKQVKSLVILSGTLNPFASFTSELGHKFDHQIMAPHLITEKQVFISCLKTGHLKQEIVGTYTKSDNLAYLDQIAKVIFDTSVKVSAHGGTLVFVPSYAFLDNLSKRVKNFNLENLFVEPKSGSQGEFEKILKKYHNRISLKQPVVLLCVYRGKAAEGMDFKDSSARAVICVGIPYPSLVDPQIELKKKYNDDHKYFKGHKWYETQAFRAVNQAAGRAIRHKDDWGIIYMLDSRYQDRSKANQLSKWIFEFLKVYDDYESCIKQLNVFLKDKNQ